MTQQQLEERRPSAASESLIVDQVENGYRVYSPANRNRLFLVTGTEEDPACTCPEFRSHLDEAGWCCKHIEAVFRGRMPSSGPQPATSSDGNGHDPTPSPMNGNGHGSGATPSQMLLKRSVSPDGRIDSLSVEFTCPVAPGTAPEEVAGRARSILSVQAGIVSFFLGAHSAGNGGNGHAESPPTANGQGVTATLLEVSGANGRWGRTTCLTFDVNGETLRFFGNKSELSTAITAAGYRGKTDRVVEGMQFNLPCRVITEPSKDGKYTNVVEVLPPTSSNGNGRRGRR